jgi:S-adenosylmethionine:tRNA ribosyltransferase-isomerase
MRAVAAAAQPVDFTLPEGAEATEPPERRGVPRDGVRLLVARPGEVAHHRFRDLPALLCEGDLLVVNTSATLPAALDGVREDGRPVVVHVATPLAGDAWVVEPRRPDGRGPEASVRAGERIRVTGGVVVRLDAPYPDPSSPPGRLWRAEVHPPSGAVAYLAAHGRPIVYPHRRGDVSLDELQNVYATHPGSAEMASAGRPFTAPLLVALMARGVVVAPVVLHAGVSSPELHEPPAPERLRVPASTARLVASTRAAGGRVVAVGTTVVRALESAVGDDGEPVARRGWTDLVLGPGRPARVVDGLVTGLHAPRASHLLLLEAVAGRDLVEAAYGEAIAAGYRWHEFGDAMMFLP